MPKNDMSFLDRYKVDIDLATEYFLRARQAAEQGDQSTASELRKKAEAVLDRVLAIYDEQQKHDQK